ncbi:aldo/keto reductase family oxidoreductase, partial [Curtobacterium sp. B8]
MKTLELPQTDLTASDVVVGLMRINDMSDEDVRALYSASRDAGVTMFDHAAIYGGWHGCEARFAEAVTLSSSERAAIQLQTKVGIRQGYFDFSYEHILSSVEESLAALRTDYIDVLLLHRPDALVEPEEVAKAFDELHAAGKVHHFGVSNHTPGQVELLRRSVNQPLAFNQVQLSITHANVIAQGVAANMGGLDQSVDRDNDILNHARLNDITLQAWSP